MWQALFFLIFGCNVYLGANFAIKFFDYVCQYPVAEVYVDHFDVQPGPKGTFFLQAVFEAEDRMVEYTFQEQFINEFIAEEAMEAMRVVPWVVYKNSSSGALGLQAYFPMKELVHVILSLGVSFYFVWLYLYSRKVGGDFGAPSR